MRFDYEIDIIVMDCSFYKLKNQIEVTFFIYTIHKLFMK